MKRVSKISYLSRAEFLLLQSSFAKYQTVNPLLSHLSNHSNHRFIIDPSNQSRYLCSNELPKAIRLLTEKEVGTISIFAEDNLYSKLLDLADELVNNSYDPETIAKILESKVDPLLRRYRDGSTFVDLLSNLKAWPQFAIEVFNWRLKMVDSDFPMVAEEYSMGIRIAGRLKNVDLAVQIFMESAGKGIKSTSIYNALMGNNEQSLC